MLNDTDAYARGCEAGRLLLPAGLNPYPLGSAQYAEWERGRMNMLGAHLVNVAKLAGMTA